MDATSTPHWRDRKRRLWLLGLVVPALPFLAAVLVELTGWAGFWWLGPFVVFGVVPVVDVALGRDGENPPDEAIAWLEQDSWYRWCTYLYLPLQYAGLVFACSRWAGGLSGQGALGLALTVGCVAAVGINTAHELGHKKDDLEKWLGKIALAQSGYGHFAVEHNRGHHVRVATVEDPASARLGENVWQYLPRTILGGLRSAWRLETRRLGRRRAVKGASATWSALSIRNDVLNAWAMSVALLAVLLLLFGTAVLPWLATQAVFGFVLLETVDYLEHYGLLRERRPDGRYEHVRPAHSWNSDNLTTNLLLYHLQRHSDHHAYPTRRYQALRSDDEAPELPAGYATLVLAAWVPAVWRRVMDHRVVAHYDGDVRRANVHEPARARLLARFPLPATVDAPALVSAGVARADDSTTGRWACPVCRYTYSEEAGAPREGFPRDTPWTSISDDWNCPDCGVRDKADFVPL
jgi:alkane 1-monooxygenase